MNRRSIFLSLAVTFLVGGCALGQEWAVVEGTAPLGFRPDRLAVGRGEDLNVEIDIDVSATRDTVCGWSGPTVLGGYQVTASFDPSSLEYLGVTKCPSAPEEMSQLVFTNPRRAEENGGYASASGSNMGNTKAPIGKGCYAIFNFRSKASGDGKTAIRFGKAVNNEGQEFSHTGAAPTRLCSNVPGWTGAAPAIPFQGYVASSRAAAASVVGEVEIELRKTSAPAPVPGDVTGDRLRDVFDVVVLSSHLAGNVLAGEGPFFGTASAADLDRSGRVDLFDLVKLAAVIAGNDSVSN